MDSIETFEDKVHFLSLMDYTPEEIQAHVANGTAELLCDIECIEGLHYASPPMGGWVITWHGQVEEIHSEQEKAFRVVDMHGGDVHFDLFAIPDHGWLPEAVFMNGRYRRYGKVS